MSVILLLESKTKKQEKMYPDTNICSSMEASQGTCLTVGTRLTSPTFATNKSQILKQSLQPVFRETSQSCFHCNNITLILKTLHKFKCLCLFIRATANA